MHFSFSDGREVFKPDMCGYCQLNTGGQHEVKCPSRNIDTTIYSEIQLWYQLSDEALIIFEKKLK